MGVNCPMFSSDMERTELSCKLVASTCFARERFSEKLNLQCVFFWVGVQRNFPQKVNWLKLKMADMRPMNMVLFFISLRVSPVVPAYLLNLAAPVTPLPLFHFWLATILGCAPHALVTVTAGRASDFPLPNACPPPRACWTSVYMLLLILWVSFLCIMC